MKKFLALVLALVMTMSLVTISAGAEDFTDAEAITYGEAVEVMTAVDVIDGYTDGSFGPAGNLTRGAAAKIICNLILGPTTAGALRADASAYSDVAADHVFAPYIAYLAKEGIVSGYADGTFKPAAPLTGYAFMKMLLGVAGYDPAIEGYTGANWSINVAKQGLANKLLDGYKGTFNGTATVNRETAMLMAFNTINSQMVEYDNKSTITVGDIVVSTNSEAKGLWGGSGANTEWLVRDEYFEDLYLVETSDAFGRPANNWWNDKDEIGLYVAEADASYTNKVDVKTIYAALGLSDDAYTYYYKNGINEMVLSSSDLDSNGKLDDYITNSAFTTAMGSDPAPATLVKKGTTKIGNAGQLVEVFYDKDTNVATIVIIDTIFGEVAKVNVDETVDERTVTIATMDFETEDFEEEDLVLYTVAYDDAGSNGEIQTVVKAEKLEGIELTKFTTKNGSTADFIGSGKTYEVAANYDSTDSSLNTIGDVLDVYTDAEGYVYYAVATASAQKFAYVIEGGKDGGRYTSAGNTYYAKVLTTEGKVEELEVGKVGTADASDSNINNFNGDIVKYALNGDGNYTLTKVTDLKVTEGLEIANGTSKIDLASSTDYYGNAKTIYLVETGDPTDPTYTAYTGYKAVPSLKGTAVDVAVYAENGTVASVVFVRAAKIAGGSSYVYVDGTSISGKITDGNNETGYYVVPAIVDGEIKTLYVDTPLSADWMLTTLISYEDGVIDWTASSDSAYYYETSTTEDSYVATGVVSAKLKDGVITVGGTAYAVADDAEAFCVKTNNALGTADTIVAGTVKGIAVGTAVTFIVTDGAIETIIYDDVATTV